MLYLTHVNKNQYATLIKDNIKHAGIKSDVLRYIKSEDLGVTKTIPDQISLDLMMNVNTKNNYLHIIY